MPIINDLQANEFLNSNRNFLRDLVDNARETATGVVRLPVRETNPIGKTKPIPDALRSLIGATATVVGDTAAAKEFGISQPTAHHIKHGHRGTHHNVVEKNDKEAIKGELAPIRSMALEALKQSILAITPEKLVGEEPAKLASIARSMSSVLKDTIVTEDDKDGNEKYQFNIFAPQVKQENHYTTIEA